MKLRYKYALIRILYVAIDVVLMALAIYLACVLRPQTISWEPTLVNVFFSALNPYRTIFVSWIFVTLLFIISKPALYQTRREMLEGFEITQLIRSIILASLVVIVALYCWRLQEFPRSILFIGTLFMAAFLSLWRLIKRMFVEYIVAQGYNNANVLTLGAGLIGDALAQQIVNTWLTTEFGGGRHAKRVDKIMAGEKKYRG